MEDEKKDEGQVNEENKSVDELSGEEILNKIEKDSAADSGDLLSRMGLSKKDKHKKETEELKKKVDEANDKYLRLYADFDNFRKRMQKERIDLIKTASADTITSLLPVLDDFNRALRQMEATKDPMTEGVKLIYQKLVSVLESKGLKAMKSVGEDFNPELHDAITETEVQDEAMKGKVADEIETGYFLNDKIIRHAKVVVGK